MQLRLSVVSLVSKHGLNGAAVPMPRTEAMQHSLDLCVMMSHTSCEAKGRMRRADPGNKIAKERTRRQTAYHSPASKARAGHQKG